jgi:hypothetical protein
MTKPEPSAHRAPDLRLRQTASEEDELFTMFNLRPDFTGFPTIWSYGFHRRPIVRHDVRVKVTKGPKYRKDRAVSVGLRPDIDVIKDQVWQSSSQDLDRLGRGVN